MKKVIITLLALFFNIGASAMDIHLNDIELKDINNHQVTLEQYKGKPIYIKMWASWCPICLAGLYDINTLSADKAKGFTILTVVSPSHQNEKPTDKFIEWYKGLDYKHIVVLLDEKGELLKRANVQGYPSSLIVDKNLQLKETIAGHLTNEQIIQTMKP